MELAPDNWSKASIVGRIVLPLEGKGDRSAVDEVHLKVMIDRGGLR